MKSMIFPPWSCLAAACLLSACGSTDMKSTGNSQSGAATSASADAQAQPPPADCAGNTLWLHGDHESCDQADIDAAKAPGGAAPAPPAGAASSGATAPAPAPSAPAPAPATPAPAPTPAPTKDPNVVEFHIKPGTGAKGYNTAATAVTVKVGQTLRLFNDDTVVHRLHTSGAPCPHQPTNTGTARPSTASSPKLSIRRRRQAWASSTTTMPDRPRSST
jgi:hypothetical protein